MEYFVFHGRMQPIHAGHVAALKMLDKAAKSTHGKAFISLTGTQDPESNPLPFEKKYKYVKAAVESWGLDITVLDKATFKIYDLMRDMSFDCQKEGGGVVHLFAGEDRIESYQKMADSMIKKYQGRGECLDVKVSVEQTMTRDDSMAYSATQMRQHVKDNDLETFIKHCPFAEPTTKDKGLCEEMFHDVAVGMGLEDDTSEKGDPYEVTEMMAKKISEHVNQLTGQPDKLYYIGGCVRDLVMGKTPNDLDLVTTMYYKDFANLFNTNDIRFRGQNIIVVPVIQGEGYEAACLPKDMTLDYRIEHSDLTMNSMVKDILTGEIYDPLGGQQDIKNNILRCTDFMIDAFGQGQQPVAVLRTLRFYSINEMTLDPASDDALYAFSTATKGKLKVTERQFEKDWHKVEKNNCQQKFIDKVKDLGLYDNLVKTQPAFAAYVNGDAAPIKESLVKRFTRLFEIAKFSSEQSNISFADDDIFKDCEWINPKISKGQFVSSVISYLKEVNDDYDFRESSKETKEFPTIDCTLRLVPTQDNVPENFGDYFIQASLLDTVKNSIDRARTALVGFVRDEQLVNIKMAQKNPHGIKLLYIVLRPHQESARGQQAYLTPLQEMIQGKAIIEKISGQELFDEIKSQDSEFKSITLNGNKVAIKDIENIDLDSQVLSYCEAARKTKDAFYQYFGHLDGLKCYHPDAKQNNVLKALLDAGKKYISGAKDAWNPTDILITKGAEYNTFKTWFDAASNISELNLIIKVLMMKTNKLVVKGQSIDEFIDSTVGVSDKVKQVIEQIQGKDGLVFIPLSLKLNYSSEDSQVESLNLYEKGKMKVNSHTSVVKAGQGFEFHAIISENDYKFTIRNNGAGSIIETMNGTFSPAKQAMYSLEEGETDVYVSKETKNKTSQLGKAWQSLKNFCPEFATKSFGEIQKMTREKVGHDTIQWDRGEAYKNSLPTQLHRVWEENRDDDSSKVLSAAMLCNLLAYYIIYNGWTTAEALIYILNASMKSNYGVFNTFAPYFKIS